MAEKFETVYDYIGSFPEDVQKVLEEIRRTIRGAVPDAAEKISYQIPTMTIGGKNFVHFAGWKAHVSLYPVPEGDESLVAEAAPYQVSKGTLKFPLGTPVPYDLVGRLAVALAHERDPRARG